MSTNTNSNEPQEPTVECPTCGGDGELATSHRFRCYSCQGTGVVAKSREAALQESEREMMCGFDNALRASEYRGMGG